MIRVPLLVKVPYSLSATPSEKDMIDDFIKVWNQDPEIAKGSKKMVIFSEYVAGRLLDRINVHDDNDKLKFYKKEIRMMREKTESLAKVNYEEDKLSMALLKETIADLKELKGK